MQTAKKMKLEAQVEPVPEWAVFKKSKGLTDDSSGPLVLDKLMQAAKDFISSRKPKDVEPKKVTDMSFEQLVDVMVQPQDKPLALEPISITPLPLTFPFDERKLKPFSALKRPVSGLIVQEVTVESQMEEIASKIQGLQRQLLGLKAAQPQVLKSPMPSSQDLNF